MRNILNNWNAARLLRLAIGIFICIQSIYIEQWFLLAVGVLYSLMPILNISSCGVGKCATPRRR